MELKVRSLKVPSAIILNNQFGKKRVIFTLAIQTLIKQGTVQTSFKEFDAICGYKPNRHKNKINDEVKSFLINLNGTYIKDLTIESGLIYFTTLPLFNNPLTYAIIYSNEFNSVINNSKTITKASALLLLSYIRMNIYNSSYFDRMDNITEEIPVLDYRSLKKSIRLLDELDIISTSQMERYKDCNNKWHSGFTIFVNKHRYIKGVDDDKYIYEVEMMRVKQTIRNYQIRNSMSNK